MRKVKTVRFIVVPGLRVRYITIPQPCGPILLIHPDYVTELIKMIETLDWRLVQV